MKVFVISLKDSAVRRKNAREQLDRAGVPFEFFDAVRGETALQSYFSGYDEYRFILNTGRVASHGEIGCYASHIALWRSCVDSNHPILILEDDFRISNAFAGAVQAVADHIDEYGFIRLQSETRAKKRFVRDLGDFKLWRYTKAPHSTMCYGIAPRVATEFLATSTTFTAPIDVHLKKFWEHGQLMYGLTPYAATESEASNASTIKGRRKVRKPVKTALHRFMTKCRWVVSRIWFNLKLRTAK